MTLALALQTAAVYALASFLSRFGTATQRRAVLLAACACAAALPLLPLLPLPAWSAPAAAPGAVLGALHVFQEPVDALPGGSAGEVEGSPSLLTAAWALGCLVAAGRLALDLRAVARLRATATAREGDVATSAAVDVPVAVGVLRPLILLPPDAAAWPAARRSLALAHERAHVRGHDNAWLLLARAAACVHWFDPLAWWTVGALRDACEHHADDAVLTAGAEPARYAEALVAVARGRGAGFGFAMARPAGLEARVRGVLSGRRRGGRLAPALAAGAVVAWAAGTATASPPVPVAALAPAREVDLGARLEAEADRLVETFAPDGVALLVLDAHTGAVLGRADRGGLTTRAVAPGSVFKPFTVVAALEAGASPDQLFAGEDLGGVLECSSNEGAVAIAAFAGRPAVAGVLARAGLPAPAEASLEDLALGNVPVTPVQLATAWTQLAGRGAIPAPIALQTRRMLIRAVTGPEATGGEAAVPGRSVAGKTGTSELPDGGTLASFVGFFPVEAPDYVVLVSVERPHAEQRWGGKVAAPAFRRIVEAL